MLNILQEIDAMFPDFEALNKKMIETSMARNESALLIAKEFYCKQMQTLYGESKPLLKENKLLEKHQSVKKDALEFFKKQPGLGLDVVSKPFFESLQEVWWFGTMLNI